MSLLLTGVQEGSGCSWLSGRMPFDDSDTGMDIDKKKFAQKAEALRGRVESFLQAKEYNKIVAMLPLFTTLSLPRKVSRLTHGEIIAAYRLVNTVASRVLATLSSQGKKESESVESITPSQVIGEENLEGTIFTENDEEERSEEAALFLRLLETAALFSLGVLFGGEGGSGGSLLERGRLLKEILSHTETFPVPDVLLLSEKRLACIPGEIGKCSNIKHLDLSKNALFSLPDALGGLVQLTHLNLSDNQLHSLPSSMKNLSSLQMIDLSYNPLKSFPLWLRNIEGLRSVTLDEGQRAQFSKEIAALLKARKGCQIETAPVHTETS